MQTVRKLLKKLKVELPVPLLGIYSKECKSSYMKGPCVPIFIAALFTTAKL
jgi:hypothetical protein